MCDGIERLMLCTCSEGKQLEVPYWELSRVNMVQPDELSRWLGRIVFSEPILTVRLFTEIINSRNCFDFNYQPLPGDQLKVVLPEETLELVYSGEKKAWAYGWQGFDEPPARTVKVKGILTFRVEN